MITDTIAAFVAGSLLGVARGIFAGAASLSFAVGAAVRLCGRYVETSSSIFGASFGWIGKVSGAGFVAFEGVVSEV